MMDRGGNVDSRSVAEQINKTFGDSCAELPAAVPTYRRCLPGRPGIMTNAVRQDKPSIMWDAPWQPIRDSAALQRYWRDDLAREALLPMQQSPSSQREGILALALTAGCYISARSAPSTSIHRASA